ncbi:SDR family NAD(P)-dependent oxidoreductase [Legionella parisiensis]|uniref:NADP-dependent 3-hydroxy acid dehydrogenase YdfG n=1 Tax=Legionella parisiensis TaxID=45071 RepID=A0A1E5JQR8_9GAMM|nr:SDR family NAD(P)-dependent oxidoreductase [Legionella parisiensis]KTD40267.1 serine 3-dehydrogenase [Legionella parisiensis]OEH46723.1 NADP-dependent 3-hydroxy acid dehydrogenase YdfG [Legionella parisiensis]STX77621.1 L-allo-threonine dehydrogenase, NAD(P)-binding [Legionella parisiensis]
MNDLTNKIILITGASSGIGQACARLSAKHGARLILSARRGERLQVLAEELNQQYGEEHYVLPLDVCDHEQVKKQLGSLPNEWRSVDVLINNAGLALDSLPLQQGIEEHWDVMIDTNIKGLLYVSRTLIPGMLERGRGHVVNISSVAGHECYPNGNVYCATKHAVHAISKSMRLDMLGSPVRVTEIAPGAVETEFSEVRWNDKQKAKQFYQDFQPLLAEDIADAIVYCITRPQHMDIEEMTIMPTVQASANHLFRNKK